MGKSREVARLPNLPAFSASKTSSQSFSAATTTKVIFNNEHFDTANCYDNTTGRFTPNVAGYYQFNATLITTAAAEGVTLIALHRNGSEYKRGTQFDGSGTTTDAPYSHHVSGLAYLNGSTDYIEVFSYFSGSGVQAETGGASFFDGYLARIA